MDYCVRLNVTKNTTEKYIFRRKKKMKKGRKNDLFFFHSYWFQLLKIAHETNKNIRSFELISIADFTILIPYFDAVPHTTDDK